MTLPWSGAAFRVAQVVLFAGLGVSCYGHSRANRAAPDIEPEGAEMVAIPGGQFTRGDLNGEPSEYPERTVTVSGFEIDRFEVSNATYQLCVAAKACDPTPYLDDPALGAADHPVVGASWYDARRFCAWLGRRLPTEAEWEYAAKGTDHRRFPWKGPFEPANANTARLGDPFDTTAPVTAMPAGDSPFGVRNMAGNAAEWVADYFDPTYYRTGLDQPDPKGPATGRDRVVRGGSYRDSSYLVRVAARRAQSPTDVDNTVGIRCAR